ncbi:MAG TPA: leucyl/phenylalanyl-tRNA--protein transferase [Rubrobacter sp.]|nr:leucyl/phenylalanyl-tRNA--protein transferase [Rubrobacter sp.]
MDDVEWMVLDGRLYHRSMELTMEVLEACYRAGAFPMADAYGRIEFYRSDPRSVLEFEDLHVPRSLWRVIRKRTFDVRVDEDFDGVIRACADREETWINPEIIDAYIRLHHAGKAHSVEAYADGDLAGGLYGVTIGGAFMGESMFTRVRDASKVCLVYLVNRLQERGYVLLDCQIQNPHLARLGAREIPEEEYLRRLRHALTLDCSFA